jgi:hypothetical protein
MNGLSGGQSNNPELMRLHADREEQYERGIEQRFQEMTSFVEKMNL